MSQILFGVAISLLYTLSLSIIPLSDKANAFLFHHQMRIIKSSWKGENKSENERVQIYGSLMTGHITTVLVPLNSVSCTKGVWNRVLHEI